MVLAPGGFESTWVWVETDSIPCPPTCLLWQAIEKLEAREIKGANPTKLKEWLKERVRHKAQQSMRARPRPGIEGGATYAYIRTRTYT